MNTKSNSAKVSMFAMFASLMVFCGCENIQNLKAGFNKWRKSEEPTKVAQEGSMTDAEPGAGEYFPVQKVTLKDSVSKRGVLSASERVDIRADKNLKLGSAKVETFAKVKKGQLLFEVDTKEIVAKQIESKERLEQAKIDLDSAKTQLGFLTKQLDRKKVLAQKGITPKKELEDTEQEFEQADTAVQTKELDLKKAARENAEANAAMTSANIISPIDGIVSKIDQGAKDVSEGHVLATISNMNSLSIYVVVDESMITRMPVGFPVEVSLDALQGKVITGVVKSAAKSQSSAFSNNFEVKVDLPEDATKGENLNDGFEASVTAVFEERKEVLAIPKAAIKQSGDGTFVLVAKSLGGRPSPRKAKIGLQTELEAEVIEGLSIGEYVVVGKRG
jgi:macrolide-specific efflux system membrane fusion protein